jgi:hypothetical protein
MKPYKTNKELVLSHCRLKEREEFFQLGNGKLMPNPY